ncbi:MAG: hypothetical protein ABF968_12890 [Acetobacter sp.]|uniref:hypothetical protein n=1 Tax=Acetobacter sp. TaxID=440 RepID=UPI0039EADEA4
MREGRRGEIQSRSRPSRGGFVSSNQSGYWFDPSNLPGEPSGGGGGRHPSDGGGGLPLLSIGGGGGRLPSLSIPGGGL